MSIAPAPVHATGHVQTNDERHNEAAHLERILSQLSPRDRETVAYDHASHGCPFLDTATICPVGCDDDSDPWGI